MEKKDAALIVLAATVVALVVAVALLSSRVYISARGSIKSVNIAVYLDVNCTQIASEIDWGVIPVGGYSQAQVYLKNEGNVPIDVNFTTADWLPLEAEQYLSLTWDLGNTTLLPDEVRGIVLSLTVSLDTHDIREFSFVIIIEGIERDQ